MHSGVPLIPKCALKASHATPLSSPTFPSLLPHVFLLFGLVLGPNTRMLGLMAVALRASVVRLACAQWRYVAGQGFMTCCPLFSFLPLPPLSPAAAVIAVQPSFPPLLLLLLVLILFPFLSALRYAPFTPLIFFSCTIYNGLHVDLPVLLCRSVDHHH